MQVDALIASIKNDRSKENLSFLLEEVLKSGLNWDEFFNKFHTVDYPYRWYLSWWFGHYVKRHKSLGNHLQKKIWNEWKEYDHDGIKRDLWRTLTYIDLEDDLLGEVYDKAIKLIPSPINPTAVRAYAMEVALNVCKKIPEITSELKLILDDLSELESSGIKARSRKYLKVLAKLDKEPY